MTRYLIRRLLWAVVLFIAVTIVTYMIFFVVPADPARLSVGQRATADEIERARHFLGLDKPVPYQYGLFLKRLVVDRSLGRSFTNRVDVTHTILQDAPVTASIVFGGDAQRGLRRDRPDHGCAQEHGDREARAPERAAPGRDDARHGHRHRARRGDLHGVDLRPAEHRQARGGGLRDVRPADDPGGGRL